MNGRIKYTVAEVVPIIALIVAGAITLNNWITYFEHAGEMTHRCGIIAASAVGLSTYVLVRTVLTPLTREKQSSRKRWPGEKF